MELLIGWVKISFTNMMGVRNLYPAIYANMCFQILTPYNITKCLVGVTKRFTKCGGSIVLQMLLISTNMWSIITLKTFGIMGLCRVLRAYPLAATYNSVLVDHENGIDNNETSTPIAIPAFITSAEFDLEDGHQFALVSKMVPDVSFEGSTGSTPTINMTLFPLNSSGSGYNSPTSESGVNTGAVVRSASVPVDVYTSEIYTRVRGRQMSMKIESSTTGVQWQLGAPRLDMRPDGRR